MLRVILEAVTSRLHHRNCLGIVFGHRNSYRILTGDLSDIRTVISGKSGLMGVLISGVAR